MNNFKYKRSGSLFYLYFPLSFLLFPTFPRITENGDYFVFLFGVSFIFITFIYTRKKIILPLVPGAYFLIMLICLLWSLVLDGYNIVVTISDISEVAKVICYFLFLLYFYNANLNYQVVLNDLVKMICVFSIFAVFFNILDVFNIFGFREISYSLYKRESVDILSNKAISPFFTTYNFASFMMMPLSFFFLCAFNVSKFSYRFYSLLMFFLVLITILLSQSRSSLITTALALLLVSFLVITARRLIFVVIIISLIVFTGVYFFDDIKELMPYTFNGIDAMMQGKSNSVNYRREQIDFVFNNINSPLGFGVSKSLYMFESLYSMYPSRYGVFFLVLFILVCFLVSFIFYSVSCRNKLTQAQRCFTLSLFVWYLTYPISGLSSAHHDTTKYSFFFYGFIGLALFLNKKANN